MPSDQRLTLNVEAAVRDRYSQAAHEEEVCLCCPVDYNPAYLEVIPQEVIERDYGCGDPSKYVQPGDVVLDLGSGGGKICFIAAQVVGETGKVIGVDCNAEMLTLARSSAPIVAERIGYDNVEFRRGQIQDLQLNLDLLEKFLQKEQINNGSTWLKAEEHARELRHSQPMIEDESVDVIVSNCVLNLVRTQDRQQLFSEMSRVLKPGGRAVISDIVSDEDVPLHLQNDPRLWSGCLSGAFREDEFLFAFEQAGFQGMELLARDEKPWGVVEGIEFRSITIRAWKIADGPCLERKQAVLYKGPWKAVTDDDGQTLRRGERMAVCDRTFQMYSQAPYSEDLILIEPEHEIPLENAEPFDCSIEFPVRTPQETKNKNSSTLTILPSGECCGTSDCC